jgi:outer membrane immunogenic protein
MKKIPLTAVAFAALAVPAMAADMAPTPVYKAPVAVVLPTWTGFYVGLNAGGAWSESNSAAVNSGLSQNFGPDLPGLGFIITSYGINSASGASGNVPMGGRSGFIGGGQIGYNWQLAPVWVAGFETDLQGLSGSGSGAITNAGGPFGFGAAASGETVTTSLTSTSKVDYLGTVRGRLGYLFTPAFLLYGTGGLAYGGAKASTAIAQSNNDCVISPTGCIQGNAAAAGALSQTRVGWTAGAGLEWMFASKWSAKVEYLHYDLGSVTYTNSPLVTTAPASLAFGGPVVVSSSSTAEFRGDFVRAGVNYHW